VLATLVVGARLSVTEIQGLTMREVNAIAKMMNGGK
jgi:hypothetical protein